MHIFGKLPPDIEISLQDLLQLCAGLKVTRLSAARSKTPYPNSTDLEAALIPLLEEHGFQHHVRLEHPRTGEGFEYDFWRPDDQVAMEIMGYRADDEVYKDILKFHVHDLTRAGVVWVPRWKWIGGRRTETNYRATMKALAFADTFMNIDALVAVTYDWEDSWTGLRGGTFLEYRLAITTAAVEARFEHHGRGLSSCLHGWASSGLGNCRRAGLRPGRPAPPRRCRRGRR